MKKYIKYIFAGFVACMSAAGCNDYLDIVPKGKKIPSTLSDYRAFMENSYIFTMSPNDAKNSVVNEFMIIPSSLPSMPLESINYLWLENQNRIVLSETDQTYDYNYQGIYYANLIIRDVPGIETTSEAEAQEALEIVAQAKVLRALHYFYLVNTYAKAYDAASATTDGGVPYISRADDMETPIPQETVEQVYQHMLDDLTSALPHLPKTARSFFQPNLASGHAMLARVQLFMRNFTEAYKNADAAIRLQGFIFDMVDYHRQYVDPEGTGREIQEDAAAFSSLPAITLGMGVDENLLMVQGSSMHYVSGLMMSALPLADSSRCENYVRGPKRFEDGDARFLCNYYLFTDMGMYSYMRRDNINTGGIRTVEAYLMRAECLARQGKLGEAMDDVNAIRAKRIIAGKYQPLSASSVAEAMEYIRHERDVELLGSGMMFYDMRRFNVEPEYRRTLKKVDHNNTPRTLPPDSELWIIPFPKSATLYNTNLKQNVSN